MATKKAAGTAKNLRDSQPKYLGIKKAAGELVKVGNVIVRQRGTKIEAGKGVLIGKDHTLFAAVAGTVSFRNMRKTRFDGKTITKKAVDVLSAA
ncbi:MAG TPA: 50S ribosomal protein L27 [Candidatus Paceibacterota bacterium]|nr:50S ribosomal protein L27 [Candidatus Paceibacterota bacterium]HMO83173.1 50S ribosomal protein L27 [Candidatus Paceibacterota bacterium]